MYPSALSRRAVREIQNEVQSGLCAVEIVEARRTIVAVAVGPRPARLASGMLRHGERRPWTEDRHSLRRHRSRVPTS